MPKGKGTGEGGVLFKVDPRELHVTVWDRLTIFMAVHWRGLLAVVIPLSCISIITSPIPPAKHQWVGYTLVVMALYWMTECIPLPVTSLLPLFIFPATGVMSTLNTIQCYVNDTIFLFIGSLFLASAIEQSGLHKRFALCFIRTIGYSHYKILFAMCFVTMFVSMWITNTAATTMMVPINFAILRVFEDQKLLKIYNTNIEGEQYASSITVCYFCAASFSATIGGIGTLVGTGTNLVFKGLMEKTYPSAPEYITFSSFSLFAIPLMLVLEFIMYLCMITVYFGFCRHHSPAAERATLSTEAKRAVKRKVREDARKLGDITYWEIMVLILFITCMVMFFCRSPKMFTGWADRIQNYYDIPNDKFIRDSVNAMFFCFLMFLLPAQMGIFKNCYVKHYEKLPKHRQKSLLDFDTMNAKLPYSFVFLLGGGFALSTAASEKYSDLNGRIGAALTGLQGLDNIFIILILIILTVFITNFASNVAVCNVITPIAMSLAEKIRHNPLLYNLATGIAASFCFCLPVGTPGNLVIQTAAKIPISRMIVAGALPSLTTIIITWLFLVVYAPIIWSDLYIVPGWISGGESDNGSSSQSGNGSDSGSGNDSSLLLTTEEPTSPISA